MWSLLPNEIVIEIFKYLNDHNDVLSLSCVDKRTRQLFMNKNNKIFISLNLEDLPLHYEFWSKNIEIKNIFQALNIPQETKLNIKIFPHKKCHWIIPKIKSLSIDENIVFETKFNTDEFGRKKQFPTSKTRYIIDFNTIYTYDFPNLVTLKHQNSKILDTIPENVKNLLCRGFIPDALKFHKLKELILYDDSLIQIIDISKIDCSEIVKMGIVHSMQNDFSSMINLKTLRFNTTNYEINYKLPTSLINYNGAINSNTFTGIKKLALVINDTLISMNQLTLISSFGKLISLELYLKTNNIIHLHNDTIESCKITIFKFNNNSEFSFSNLKKLNINSRIDGVFQFVKKIMKPIKILDMLLINITENESSNKLIRPDLMINKFTEGSNIWFYFKNVIKWEEDLSSTPLFLNDSVTKLYFFSTNSNDIFIETKGNCDIYLFIKNDNKVVNVTTNGKIFIKRWLPSCQLITNNINDLIVEVEEFDFCDLLVRKFICLVGITDGIYPNCEALLLDDNLLVQGMISDRTKRITLLSDCQIGDIDLTNVELLEIYYLIDFSTISIPDTCKVHFIYDKN